MLHVREDVSRQKGLRQHGDPDNAPTSHLVQGGGGETRPCVRWKSQLRPSYRKWSFRYLLNFYVISQILRVETRPR